MLTPDARVVLLEQLRAPEGFAFDAGLATTFTLDLASALIPPLAFAGAAFRNRADPLSALAAVRACTEKLDIFCQVGQVAVPREHSALFSYLERMVHPVSPPAGGLFHPKIWFLRYVSTDLPSEYRLLCLSRNLTADHSWDVALRLDGVLEARKAAAREPLGAFLRSLPARAVSPLAHVRGERVAALADEASRLAWQYPEHVQEMHFHAFGVPGVRPEPDFSGYRHLAVSPFADEQGLERVTGADPKSAIVSRAETLDRLRRTWLDAHGPYFVVDTMAAQDADAEAVLLEGLHAKAYVAERNHRAHLFVGSANATQAAFGRNVEFLVELVAGYSKLGVAHFLDADKGLGALLVPYEPTGDGLVPESELEQKRLENLLRSWASKRWTVTVGGAAEPYHLDVTADPLDIPEDVAASVELLTRRSELRALRTGHPHVAFADVVKVDVTPFLGLHLRGRSGVEVSGVVLALLVDDPEDRLDEILAAQIDTPEKFLRFLALLLNVGGPHLLQLLAGKGSGIGGPPQLGPAPGIFEVVLQALTAAPSSIDDLDRLVRQMEITSHGMDVLPDGFLDLWRVVREAHSELTGER